MVTHRAPRWYGLDAVRGLAILLMIAFHFCFDLTYWHLAEWAMLTDWRWLLSRDLIVSLFLLVVGISLMLAPWDDVSARRRLWRLAGCAVLVSLVSLPLFAERFIYFGILHFICLASWLGMQLRRRLARVAFLPRQVGLLLLAILCLATWTLEGPDWMAARALNWLGFAPYKPYTEDYVPLFPWFGMVLAGMFLAGTRWLQPLQASGSWYQPLAWLGRHSLLIYLLHQPILMAALALWVQVLRPFF